MSTRIVTELAQGKRWLRHGLALAIVGSFIAGLAAQREPAKRAVSWDRARAEVSKYRATIDSSGLVDVDAYISPRVDAEDLQALCQARRDAVKLGRATAQGALAALPRGRDPITDDRRAMLRRQLGAIASFEGDMATAREQFEAAREALAPYVDGYPDLKAKWTGLDQAAAVAGLRQGEIENCLAMPNADRCIFPLRAGAVHQHTSGAQLAFDRLQPLAVAASDNLELRWLVNLSAMALGRYPDAVPAAARIPASVFTSTMKLPHFTDVARDAHISRMDTAGGTITDDFDDDGLLDIVFTSVDYCTPARFYHNRGDGTFDEVTMQAGPVLMDEHVSRGAAVGDLDNDGRLDLVINDLDGKPQVLHNEVTPSGHWLSVTLVGKAPNTLAIGAIVTARVGQRRLQRLVQSGSSYLSQDDMRLHFGLGAAETIDELDVRWPDDSHTSQKNVRADQRLTLTQAQQP